MTASGKRFDPFVAFLVVACVGLAVLATLLARQNRDLKERLASDGRYAARQAEALKPGDLVKPFPVIDASGRESTIGFGEGESSTILLVYSTTCPACQEAIPRWKAVLGSTPPTAVRILALERDRLDPARSAAALVLPALPFPAYTVESSGTELAKKLPFIPATVVLDDKGIVTHAWFGALTREKEEELLRLMGTASS
jgi:hypothetical protein